MHVLFLKYWVELHLIILGKQAELAATNTKSPMQEVQPPVLGSKSLQRAFTSTHLFLRMYCLLVQLRFTVTHNPLTSC